MTQPLIRIGLALVVLLAVAGLVGIASAEMAPGVDEQHTHGVDQVDDRISHDHIGEHAANGTDREAGDRQHGQHGAHERGQHGAAERHGQHSVDERYDQHSVDERHGQHGTHGAHDHRGQHGHASGPASGW